MVFLNDANFVELLKDKMNIKIKANVRKYGSLGTVCPQYNLEKVAVSIAEKFLINNGIVNPVIFAMSSYGFIYVINNKYGYKSFIEISSDCNVISTLDNEQREMLEKLRKLYIVETGEEIVLNDRVIRVLHAIEIDSEKRNVNDIIQEWIKNNKNKQIVSINVIENKINIIFE